MARFRETLYKGAKTQLPNPQPEVKYIQLDRIDYMDYVQNENYRKDVFKTIDSQWAEELAGGLHHPISIAQYKEPKMFTNFTGVEVERVKLVGGARRVLGLIYLERLIKEGTVDAASCEVCNSQGVIMVPIRLIRPSEVDFDNYVDRTLFQLTENLQVNPSLVDLIRVTGRLIDQETSTGLKVTAKVLGRKLSLGQSEESGSKIVQAYRRIYNNGGEALLEAVEAGDLPMKQNFLDTIGVWLKNDVINLEGIITVYETLEDQSKSGKVSLRELSNTVVGTDADGKDEFDSKSGEQTGENRKTVEEKTEEELLEGGGEGKEPAKSKYKKVEVLDQLIQSETEGSDLQELLKLYMAIEKKDTVYLFDALLSSPAEHDCINTLNGLFAAESGEILSIKAKLRKALKEGDSTAFS